MLTQEIELTALDTQTDQTPDVQCVDLKTFYKVALFFRKIGETKSEDDGGAWCW